MGGKSKVKNKMKAMVMQMEISNKMVNKKLTPERESQE